MGSQSKSSTWFGLYANFQKFPWHHVLLLSSTKFSVRTGLYNGICCTCLSYILSSLKGQLRTWPCTELDPLSPDVKPTVLTIRILAWLWSTIDNTTFIWSCWVTYQHLTTTSNWSKCENKLHHTCL